MSFRIKLLSFILVQSLLLIGCSGDSDFNLGGGDGNLNEGGTTTDPSETPEETEGKTSAFSYYTLSVYETSKEFSGAPSDGLYQGENAYPFIQVNLINPVVALNLTSTNLATANDYSFTVDDIEADPTESFPILQKVIGSPVSLETALVFDVSGSVSEVDFAALVAEAKAYITTAQASTNSLIANQQYVIWAFGKQIIELTSGFSNDINAINAALDQVIIRRNDKSLGSQSNLHKAIVESIGRYKDATYDFRDSSTVANEDNDLIDYASSNGILLSQMVLFSSGPDTFLEMNQSLMLKAIKSQGFSRFEDTEQEFTNKPIFYYVTGGTSQGVSYSALGEEAEITKFLTLTSGAYSFSSDLIQNQIDAVEVRIDLDNQYIYRTAFLPRVGDHSVIFKANSSVYQSTLSSSFKADDLALFVNTGTPSEVLSSMGDYPLEPGGIVFANGLVEITGPNGEYLSGFAASLAEVSTFLPATRWVSDEYATDDYAWSFPGGDGAGTLNANGSYTVNSITGATAFLQLENTVLGYTTLILISN
jgi:hypothetical protein